MHGSHLSSYSYHNIIDHIPCAALPCDLFYDWKFMPFNPLRLFHFPCQPSTTSFSLYEFISVSQFVFCFVF